MPDKNHLRQPQPEQAARAAPPAPPDLQSLARRVAELQATLDQIQEAMQRSSQIMRHPPVHLNMERLEVQQLVFHFDTIHVDDLGGELNIGFTQMFKPGQGGQSAARDDRAPDADSDSAVPVPPTPPMPPMPPIAGGSPASHRPPRATLPGSVISRWLREGPPKKPSHPQPTPPGSVTATAAPSPPKEWPIWPPPEEVEGEP